MKVPSGRTMWRRANGRGAALRRIARRARRDGLSPVVGRNTLRVLNPGTEVRPVIIASTMRTGSTLLCGMAESLDGVDTTYEALNPVAYGWMNLRGADEAATLVRDLSTGAPVMVTKVFHSHLDRLGCTWAEFADRLPEARWIQLYRHDVLAQYVSLRQAETSGRWVNDGTPGKRGTPEPVDIDLDGLADFHDRTVGQDREAYDALIGRGLRQVRYEDFSDDPTGWAARYLPDLLGLQTETGPVDEPFSPTVSAGLVDRVTDPTVLDRAEQAGLRWHPAGQWS